MFIFCLDKSKNKMSVDKYPFVNISEVRNREGYVMWNMHPFYGSVINVTSENSLDKLRKILNPYYDDCVVLRDRCYCRKRNCTDNDDLRYCSGNLIYTTKNQMLTVPITDKNRKVLQDICHKLEAKKLSGGCCTLY